MDSGNSGNSPFYRTHFYLFLEVDKIDKISLLYRLGKLGKFSFYRTPQNPENPRLPKGERDGNILYYSVLEIVVLGKLQRGD